MRAVATAVDGAFVLEGDRVDDDRGFFRESYRASVLERAIGREVRFRQANHSRSRPGVLRGFHAEPWDKLIYVPHGAALCAVADVRPDSPGFGTVALVELGGSTGSLRRLFVSRGLANAFLALEETDYLNDVSEEFAPEGRGGFAWNDPTLAVDWPIESPILSEFDRGLPTLREVFPDHPLFSS